MRRPPLIAISFTVALCAQVGGVLAATIGAVRQITQPDFRDLTLNGVAQELPHRNAMGALTAQMRPVITLEHSH